MSRMWSKLVSVMLVLSLVVAWLPVGSHQVAAASDYFQIANFNDDVKNPTEVNTQTVDLVGTFTGVSANSISYEIDTIILKEDGSIEVVSSRKGTDVKPVIENSMTFRFPGIKLDSGLNRITVKGNNSLGNVVSAEVFVRYSNAPMLYDIKAADGRILRDSTDPTVIDTKSITLRATNAKEVYVNGKKMYSGDGKNYVASDIPLVDGLNTLVITASNEGKTITETREVVYYGGGPTAYNLEIGNTKVEKNGIVNKTASSAEPVKVAVVFKLENTAQEQLNNLKLTLTDPNNNLESVTGTASNLDKVSKDSRFITFFYSNLSPGLTVNAEGRHNVHVQGEYGKQTVNYAINFTNRTSSSAYITDIQQLFNVIDDGSKITYDRSAPLSSNATFLGLPVYILVKTSAATSVDLKSLVNGNAASNFDSEQRTLANGEAGIVFKITSMPPGQQNLVFTPGGSAADSRTITVSYVSAPYLEIVNIQDGTILNKNKDLEKIIIKHTNFSQSDLSSIKLSINGRELTGAPNNNNTDNLLEYTMSNDEQNLLVAGPNTIKITGTTNGIPVSTTITIYIFARYSPEISAVFPVPFVVDPAGIPIRQNDDPSGLFKLVSDNKYATSEKSLEVLFTVRSADKFDVRVDGKLWADAKLDDNGWLFDNNQLFMEGSEPLKDENGNTMTDENGNEVTLYHFRLLKQPNDNTDALSLSKTGEKSITITARKGSANVSHTITIVKENASFSILSPKLPDESVINQNFLKVSIEAEGANQVLIGKQELVKDKTNDIFRGEVSNLKVGKNTIKFTVIQGDQKINGQFTVNYAGEKLPGALYKTEIPKSGKTTLFKGDMTISLPKGTLLREANTLPGQAPPEINMFDNQQILFGIADKNDGRILKKYNAVGEEVSGRPQDGIIKEIPADFSAIQWLTLPSRYGYASELFWMDAGYIEKDSMGNVTKVIEGKLPYKSYNDPIEDPNFYDRSNIQWMEPTQRGTITIKYDPNIRDAIAANLGIWRWVDRDQMWVPLGGTIDAKKQTITAPFDGFGYYAILGLRYTFDDIIGHPYARNSLEIMLSSKIMNPIDDYEFGVYENVSRGEFATMLVKILDIPLEYDENNPTFDDVGNYGGFNVLWDYRYVETAVRKGIIRGIAPRVFDPNGDLTREHAATMIARALNLKLGTKEKDLPKLQKQFTDANTIDPYMVPAVLAVNKAGYIEGLPNQMAEGQKKPTYRFDPTSNLKRADAAVIAERIMRKLKKIK